MARCGVAWGVGVAWVEGGEAVASASASGVRPALASTRRWWRVYFLALELYTAYFSARVSTAPGGLKRMPRSLTMDSAFCGS